MKDFNFSFVPPPLRGFFTTTKYDQRVFDTYASNWWEKHSICQYPSLLISYKYKLDSSKQYNNLRKLYRIPKKVTVFADSGAYTAVAKGIKLDPTDVFDWQRRNGDIAFIVDEIPATVEIVSSVGKRRIIHHTDFKSFKASAEQTYRNCEIFFKLRGNDTYPAIYGITHGLPARNLLKNQHEDLYEYWFDLMKDFPFDGWGTGFKPQENPLLQALGLMKLYNKGIRSNIHLLGVAASKAIPVMIWSKRYIKNITFDGTRYGAGAMSRMYFYPNKISRLKFWGERKWKDPSVGIFRDWEEGKLQCNCDICKTVKLEKGTLTYYNEEGSFPGLLLSMHNILVHEDLLNEYEKRINDKDSYLRLVKQHVDTSAYIEVKNAINFIEDCINDGFDKTYNKYLTLGYDFGFKNKGSEPSLI